MYATRMALLYAHKVGAYRRSFKLVSVVSVLATAGSIGFLIEDVEFPRSGLLDAPSAGVDERVLWERKLGVVVRLSIC